MMNKEVQELIELLGYKKDSNTLRYNRNFYNTKVLPFFSRNPERAKFTNGFNPIISTMLRISFNENAEYEFSEEEFREYLTKNLSSGPKKEEFIDLLMNHFGSINFKNPYFLKYIPLSKGKEREGEIEIALLLNYLFELSNLTIWNDKLNNRSPQNLLEKLLNESFPIIKEETKNRRKFAGMDINYYRDLGRRDLTVLLKDREFFMENVELFFAYYYFFYISQIMLKIQMRDTTEKPEALYYALDVEGITGTRLASTSGYKKITSVKKDLLPRLDYLDYLNILNGNKENYYFTKDFNNLSNFEEKELNDNLNQFNSFYAEIKNKNRTGRTFENNTTDLFKWLREDINNESISRFPLALDEIAKKYFIKPRGRLGNTLNMRNDLLLLITALIVDDEKMLIDEVFKGFEARGIYFDRYTKTEILHIYNKSNILEKKSDSGDAQYVKPIL